MNFNMLPGSSRVYKLCDPNILICNSPQNETNPPPPYLNVVLKGTVHIVHFLGELCISSDQKQRLKFKHSTTLKLGGLWIQSITV